MTGVGSSYKKKKKKSVSHDVKVALRFTIQPMPLLCQTACFGRLSPPPHLLSPLSTVSKGNGIFPFHVLEVGTKSMWGSASLIKMTWLFCPRRGFFFERWTSIETLNFVSLRSSSLRGVGLNGSADESLGLTAACACGCIYECVEKKITSF